MTKKVKGEFSQNASKTGGSSGGGDNGNNGSNPADPASGRAGALVVQSPNPVQQQQPGNKQDMGQGIPPSAVTPPEGYPDDGDEAGYGAGPEDLGNPPSRRRLKWWARARDYWILGIAEKDGGSYFAINPQGSDLPGSRLGERIPSPRQVEQAILRLVLEQGCDTIYCYRGNKIDPHMTQIAKSVLYDLTKPGGVLEGRQVSVSDKLKPELEPWRGRNFITRPFAEVSHEKALAEENKVDTKAMKKEEKRQAKLDRQFTEPS